ncbi:MAG: hypothetical protein E6H84_13305 [Chloroflexi bacterium]|nr:MAG: hypothetical protein E6H84_13305 [Chloroflexota bacterium]TMG68601.1 MAG: hypothetical protein E6H81_12260 [Chloroflexota bacterium]
MKDAIVIPVTALRRIFVMLLLLIALILLVLVVRTQLFRAGISTLFAPSAAELIERNLYQAVFLANGSTYFGKLQEQGSDWFVLSDVFYISVSDQSGTQLIKRGTEPQGPKEPMIISRQQVLFIENMRDDSDIVTLIKKFKSGQLPTATPPPPTVAPTTGRPSVSPSPSR